MRSLLLAIVLLVFVESAQSQQPSPSEGKPSQPEQPQSPAQQPPAPEQRGTEQSPFIVKVQPTPKTQTETDQEAKDRLDKASYDRNTLILSLLLVIVAFLQFVAISLQAVFLWLAFKATKKSVDVAEATLIATQRPWVSVHPRLASGLSYDPEGNAKITIGFVLKNVGDSPAANVVLVAQIRPIFGDAVAEKDTLCGGFRPPSQAGDFGLALFPQQELTWAETLIVNRKEIEDHHRSWIERFGVREDRPVAWPGKLIGCVSYKFTFSDDYHQTGFIADLLRPSDLGPEHPPRQFAAGQNVPIEELQLIPSYRGSSAN